ncbi:hypothetical protein OESDEN_01104 [Oesophagostomum dentatum]|uniref:Uncharacterized protein n=1 Tax=Oesophagostomum dentatum TaxID=61180 RepID=A0A0B1TRZ7_OESDE|nr:hypothetical protein OESDEN_01104 [Oesophagostomum dentatum]
MGLSPSLINKFQAHHRRNPRSPFVPRSARISSVSDVTAITICYERNGLPTRLRVLARCRRLPRSAPAKRPDSAGPAHEATGPFAQQNHSFDGGRTESLSQVMKPYLSMLQGALATMLLKKMVGQFRY